MTETIGFIAAFCTTISFLPQLIHTVKTRNTTGISLGMYSFFVSGVILWLSYGILLGSVPIIVANVLTLVFSSVILGMKISDLIKKT